MAVYSIVIIMLYFGFIVVHLLRSKDKEEGGDND